MEFKNTIKERNWLKLLKEAIEEGAEIQVNHRYKYKNKNLGTFLTDARAENRVERIKKIEDLGFSYKMHSNKPKDYVERFITELWSEKKTKKGVYSTRFYSSVFPKKEILDEEIIEELNVVWKMKFGEERKWVRAKTAADRAVDWKVYRYDKEINPEGKWFTNLKGMEKLFRWVYDMKVFGLLV